MKDTGILTFCNANNYGAVLQAYALKKYISSLNYNVEFINLNFNKFSGETKGNDNIKHNSNLYSKIIDKIRREKFKNFKRKYLNISENVINGDGEISNLEKEYDYYVVGSDQVWNTDITRQTKSFFFDFVKNNPKISYAASYGKKDLNDLQIKWSKEELPKFKYISVREKDAKDDLEKMGIKSELVCDPVFLLDRDEWNKNINLKKQNKKKYIFVYYMEATEEIEATVEKMKKEYKLPVIAICGGGNKRIHNCKHLEAQGPEEFLQIINGAEMIITNSFHAVAFSLIFRKKVIVVSHSKWNVRIENLLNLIDSKDKIIKIIKDINSGNIINGEEVYDKMESIISSSKLFLENALK